MDDKIKKEVNSSYSIFVQDGILYYLEMGFKNILKVYSIPLDKNMYYIIQVWVEKIDMEMRTAMTAFCVNAILKDDKARILPHFFDTDILEAHKSTPNNRFIGEDRYTISLIDDTLFEAYKQAMVNAYEGSGPMVKGVFFHIYMNGTFLTDATNSFAEIQEIYNKNIDKLEDEEFMDFEIYYSYDDFSDTADCGFRFTKEMIENGEIEIY